MATAQTTKHKSETWDCCSAISGANATEADTNAAPSGAILRELQAKAKGAERLNAHSKRSETATGTKPGKR